MKTNELRIFVLAMAITLVLQISSLKAQTTYAAPFTITGTGANYQFGLDGTFSSTGSGPYTWHTTSAQLLWNPALASFSVVSYSLAEDDLATVSGKFSIAMGYAVTASGTFSMASGAFSTASGYFSAAIGDGPMASGDHSSASGIGSTASGGLSTASGFYSIASGNYSTAHGFGSIASGNYSTASGYYVTAAAMNSFVVGSGNVGGGSPTSWVSTDPLFEVGNGTYGPPGWTITPSDAFVVYKNGSATFQGPVTVGPGGDIPMFNGTN